MKKIFLIFIFVLFFSKNIFASDSPQYNAGSVLVMDAKTAAVLYEDEGYARRFPASITKIMTALLVLERAEDLSAPVIFSENAVTLPDYAGRMNILAGESLTVLESLYGLMLPSANDIARGLAEFISGDIDAFVAEMNSRAEKIGAHETRFINPCGLPGDGQFVTAHDIALIMREAIKIPLFTEIISTPYFELPPTNLFDEPRIMRNSNLMVNPSRAEFNSRIIGGKTGFTNAAQHTLVSYAAFEGREIIISVLFTTPRGAIFSDTAAVLEYIFENFPAVEEIFEEEIILREKIILGFDENAIVRSKFSPYEEIVLYENFLLPENKFFSFDEKNLFFLRKKIFSENEKNFSENEKDFSENENNFLENEKDFFENEKDFFGSEKDFSENEKDFSETEKNFSAHEKNFQKTISTAEAIKSVVLSLLIAASGIFAAKKIKTMI